MTDAPAMLRDLLADRAALSGPEKNGC